LIERKNKTTGGVRCGRCHEKVGGEKSWAGLERNSGIFDLVKRISKGSDLIRLKDGLSELKIFKIKYGCEGIKIRNNFPYWKFSKFGIEFELKFREGSRCLNSNEI
jgi:hypothetical protein